MSKALAKRNVGLVSSQTKYLITIALIALIIYLILRSRGTASQFTNLEKWEWMDWKGRERQITVHREAKTQ